MARVRNIAIDEVPEDLRPIYRRFADEYGPFLNQVKVFAHRPPALRHVMGLLLDLADEAVLPKRYLEIALVVVSKLNECTYCVAHHEPRLTRAGLAPHTVSHILDDDCPGLGEVDRLVRDYAVQVTTRPQRIRDSMFDALRRHFTEEQVVELTLRTALCGFFTRFNEAMRIDVEDGVVEDMLAQGLPAGDLPDATAARAVTPE